MRVQNRKTGAEHIISVEEWNFMKTQSLHLIFRVLDAESAGRKPVKINIPEQINEFKIARESVNELKIEPNVVEVPLDIHVTAEVKPVNTTKK